MVVDGDEDGDRQSKDAVVDRKVRWLWFAFRVCASTTRHIHLIDALETNITN